jgi:outer membrane receptor protein involved in Fe transport
MIEKRTHQQLGIRSHRALAVGALIGSLAVVMCHPVAAADTSADQDSKLEEIVVTAQRRVEKLQNVPISAQVIGSQILAEQNYNSLDELTQIVPGVRCAAFDPSTGGIKNPHPEIEDRSRKGR